jgi:nucleoside phosphorylase
LATLLITTGERLVEKTLAVVDYILNIPPEHMVFLMAVLAISVAGYALYVVLEVLRSMSRKPGD